MSKKCISWCHTHTHVIQKKFLSVDVEIQVTTTVLWRNDATRRCGRCKDTYRKSFKFILIKLVNGRSEIQPSSIYLHSTAECIHPAFFWDPDSYPSEGVVV